MRKTMKRRTANDFYLSSEKVTPLKDAKTFNIYVKNPLGINLREFCFVTLEGKRRLVDVVTGSFYCTMTGYCKSTKQLQLVGGMND
jgi:hypothetical protein